MHVVPPPSPGASEMLMATAVQELASKTPGKESIAMEGFARALRKVHTEYLPPDYSSNKPVMCFAHVHTHTHTHTR